jgi:hypothetical protein
MENYVVAALRQLLNQSPVLVVYVVGMILGAALCARCRAAGLLVVAGMALLFFSSIAWTFGVQYIYLSRTRWGWLDGQFSMVITVGALLINAIHAIGVGLLLVAAFVGRRTVTESWKSP